MSQENDFTNPFPDHRIPLDAGEPLVYPLEAAPEMGKVVEVAPGVLWLRTPLPFSLEHINLYLVEDEGGWAIVDTGLNTSMVRNIWENVFEFTLKGAPITKIIVTHYHPDHMGCAGWLHEKTGAPLYMTRDEYFLGQFLLLGSSDTVPQEMLDFYKAAGFPNEALEILKEQGFANYKKGVASLPIQYHRLQEGDTLKIGARDWKILVGNGHSPEHACLYSPDDGILISGDQVLPKITSNISVYPTEPLANPLKEWLDSLCYLKENTKPGTLTLPAHNEVFLGLHKRLVEMHQGHVRRLDAVAKECAQPKCAIEAFPALFRRKLKGLDFILGTGEALAHLHFLEDKGVLERVFIDEKIKFKTIRDFDKKTDLEVVL